MKKVTKLRITLLLTAILLVSVSCSSQGKKTGDVYALRNQAESSLSLGNREADRGNYESALLLFGDSKRKAILADDHSLMIRTGLSRGNVLFTLGQRDEAFAEWEASVALAQNYGNHELLSASRIYHARGRLISGKDSAQTVLDEVNREAVNIKSDKLFIAFSWYVKGLSLRELKSYREAEDAIRKSLDIHEKGKYLENASYDWYLIASIRSLAGNIDGALQALESAIALDRRIENSWGLATDWRAMGDVYRKAGKNREAVEAYRRAREIFLAMGNDLEAAEVEKRGE